MAWKPRLLARFWFLRCLFAKSHTQSLHVPPQALAIGLLVEAWPVSQLNTFPKMPLLLSEWIGDAWVEVALAPFFCNGSLSKPWQVLMGRVGATPTALTALVLKEPHDPAFKPLSLAQYRFRMHSIRDRWQPIAKLGIDLASFGRSIQPLLFKIAKRRGAPMALQVGVALTAALIRAMDANAANIRLRARGYQNEDWVLDLSSEPMPVEWTHDHTVVIPPSADPSCVFVAQNRFSAIHTLSVTIEPQLGATVEIRGVPRA